VPRATSGIDGVLLLDKHVEISSNGALQSARRLYNWAKAGHTGTLDPLASGLLPICFGEATKFAQGLLDAPKRYDAVLKLGFVSNTGDAEGDIQAFATPNVKSTQIDAALGEFRGRIDQCPPMYSALKLNGRPLYDYARAGLTVERVSRAVEIFSLEVIERQGDELSLAVSCSKGTYIRVLAQDIGKALGCGAYLKKLRRTAIGQFDISSAIALDALATMSLQQRLDVLAPIDSLVPDIPALQLTQPQATRLAQGQAIEPEKLAAMGNYRMYGPSGIFLGVGESSDGSRVVVRRLVSTNSSNYLKSLENTG
jgi:tRNA pseudouridine55 synthase